jgi:hypothetical protein
LLKKALRATPNSRDAFPTYDDMVRMGLAMHGAFHNPGDGQEAWHEWAERWEGNDYDFDVAEARWGSFKPPHSLGATYIYDKAAELSDGAFAGYERWFDGNEAPVIEPESAPPLYTEPLFGDPAPRGPKGVVVVTERPDPTTIPTRQWLVAPLLPIGDVTQCVGEPAVSKSSYSIMVALAVASGEERILRGAGEKAVERLHRSGPVIIYNSEDRNEEMQRRLTAAMSHYGLTRLKHPIYLWSGLDDQITIMERKAAGAAAVRAEAAEMLWGYIASTRAALLVLDPQVSLGRGIDENNTDDMNALLQELATKATSLNISILLIHHTGKKSRNDTGDMGAGRGSFAVAGKIRSMVTLTKVSKSDAETWGLPPEDLLRVDYGKVSHGRRPAHPTLIRRLEVRVGNGVAGADSAARELFDASPGETLRIMGDTAPVLEVIGSPRTTQVSTDGKATNEREIVARAVLAVMRDRTEIKLSDEWEAVTAALHAAGHTKAVTRQSIIPKVAIALQGHGVTIERNGQSVRLTASKAGSWVITASSFGSDKLSAGALESLESSENKDPFS